MGKPIVLTLKEGTDTSGFHGHRGRPGHRGGSLPEGRQVSQSPDVLAANELVNARRTFVRRIGWIVYNYCIDRGLSPATANNLKNIAQQTAYQAVDNMNASEERYADLASRPPHVLMISPELSMISSAVVSRMRDVGLYIDDSDIRTESTANVFSRLIEAQNGILSPSQLGDFIDTTEQTGNAVSQAAAVQPIDQILGTTPSTTGTNFISDESVDSGIRGNIQTVQNIASRLSDSTRNDILQKAEDQTRSDFAFNNDLDVAGMLSPSDRDAFNAYHNFLHRGEPYTNYFHDSGEVDATKSMLNAWARNHTDEVSTRMTNILGVLENNRNFFGSRQEFENAVNDTEAMAGEQLTPIARARMSALYDYFSIGHGVIPTQSATATQRSRASRAATPEPAAVPVPEVNTTQDFQTFSTNLTNNATQRQERIAYRALYTLATDPTITADKVVSSLSQFDTLYPNRLSSEQKAAFVKGWELHHGEPAAAGAAMALPDNFKSYIDKAQHGQLVQEVKDSTIIRPLDVASAVELSGMMTNDDVDRANQIIKNATGTDVDSMQFINHSYNFEASGIWTKITGVTVGRSSINVTMNVFTKDDDGNEIEIGNGQRTLNSDGEIHNDLLTVKRKYEGRGFGTAFYKHAEDAAVKVGFKKMTILANIDVGGYSWAAMGFEATSQSTIDSYVRQLSSNYRNAYNSDLPVMPKHMWEIAAYRGPDGEEIGRKLLLGEHWYATKTLSDRDIGFAIGRAYYAKPKTPKKVRR